MGAWFRRTMYPLLYYMGRRNRNRADETVRLLGGME